MLLLRLWNYIRGYVIIVVEGYFLEKFINICIHREIYLWDIKRLKDEKMLCKISVNGFRALRPIAKKSKSRVKIYKRVGIPFILNRYRHRKAFLVGAVIFIAAIYIMSSFVWSIEITGNNKLDAKFLESKLEALGVKEGVLKYGINADKVANGLMLEVKDLAWAGITVKGTKVKVTIVEGSKPPELVPLNKPCNIVATRDGVIKRVTAKSGQEKVKAGDTVVKGQLLISGIIENPPELKDVPVRTVHATGTVIARTWYEQKYPVTLKYIEKQRTGKTKDNYAIVLFGKKINLFPGKIPFQEYDSVELKNNLSIGDMALPFGFITYRNYEVRTVENELDLDTAKELAADMAYSELAKQLSADVQIVDKSVKFVDDGNGNLNAIVTLECSESIGATQEIGGE